MYYTRPVGVRRTTRAFVRLAAAMLIVVPLAAQQLPAELAGVASFSARHKVRRERVAIGASAIDVTVSVPVETTEADFVELLSITRTALGRLGAWLGPLPAAALTVMDVPWHVGVAGASYPGLVVTSRRWLSTSRDPVLERTLLAALARQYTFSIAAPGDAHEAFEEGLALYLAARLIRDQLHSRNFETPRFFGGFIPFSLRSLLNSEKPEDPRPTLLHTVDVDPAARRMAAALQTFERHVGWPAFQQVLEQFMARFRGRAATPADLAAVASEAIGRDLSTFFEEGMLDEEFDCAIVDLRNEPADGRFATTVAVRRSGRALPLISVPLLVRFADGAEISERVNFREREHTFSYLGAAPAVLASIDPDAVLLIDSNRGNNTKALDPPVDRIGIRLALNWMLWLQDAMLAYTAVL